MAFAKLISRAPLGIRAVPVTVEVHLSGGLPAFNLVGLPEAAVKESRDRVRSALLNSHFDFPASRITVNLAPADLPKDGGRFDLPIALGILAASGQIPAASLAGIECIGELALDGSLRAIPGALPTALAARDSGHSLFVPEGNGQEAARVDAAEVLEFTDLLSVTAHLHGRERREPVVPLDVSAEEGLSDLADVKGQSVPRRALEIAAAGGHNLLLAGPPGTGKSMLAARLPGILPPMTETEALESAAIASVTGGFDLAAWGRRPYRSPHHTASAVALVGGGSIPRPGEISRAHGGVLFLDELPEFDRHVLDVLREPLESGVIHISRAARQAEFPASFQLVAAMNPCPCGFRGDPETPCRCTPDRVARYAGRISGPFMDRIDLHVTVPRLRPSELRRMSAGESSETVRERVVAAWRRQRERQGDRNARLGTRELEGYWPLANDVENLLEQASARFRLSARSHHRLWRVAATIADLAGSDMITTAMMAEALSYRPGS